MAVYGCTGVLLLQVGHQPAQGFALLRRARVLWCLAIRSAATDRANSYTVGVMPGAVRAYLRHWSASVYASVPVDNIMVADTLPATRFVPAVNIRHGVVSALGRSATVQYNFLNLSHTNIRFVVLV